MITLMILIILLFFGGAWLAGEMLIGLGAAIAITIPIACAMFKTVTQSDWYRQRQKEKAHQVYLKINPQHKEQEQEDK